jgi:ankyrin repeat protein
MRIVLWSSLILSVVVTFGSAVRAAEDSPLVQGAQAGDIPRVRELIASGEDVDATAGDGSAPLLWAAYNFDAAMARILIEAGASVDLANNYGITPLLQASRTGDNTMIGILLDAGADPALTHPEGETPLMAASRSGNVPAVRLLLERGAHVNAAEGFQKQTALMWAAAEGHADVVDVLLEAGADPNLQAHVNVLTERQNADHPTGGFSALMWAARNGDAQTARRLVDGGADLDLANGDGATATMIAIYNDRFDTAKALIDLGGGINDGSLYTAVEMRSSTTDQFAFDGSRLRPDHDNERTALDLVDLLLERGADPHQWFAGQFHSTSMPNSDRFANTPFFRAATAADAETLRVFAQHVTDFDRLLAVPAEPVVEDADAPAGGRGGRGNANEGRTAIMAAIGGGRAPGMTGGPGYIRSGETPYRESGSREPKDAIAALLEAGADPNVRATDGSTALHQAVQARNVDIIRALAEGGADLTLTNADGFTALDVAEGKRPEGEAAADGRGGEPGAGGRGGRGGRGGASPEVQNVLREYMGLPPVAVEASESDSGEAGANDGANNE